MATAHRFRELATFLVSPSGSAAYCGFVGHGNLGDEVLFDQIKRAFAPVRLVSAPPLSDGFRGHLISRKRHDVVILGGGTLIGGNRPDGSNPFREHFQSIRSRGRRTIVFGTGVGALSPDPNSNRWLDYWKPILQAAEYVSVRDPTSARSLASIGIEADVIGDPACLIAQEIGFWSPGPKKTLGINVAGLGKSLARLEQSYLEALAAFIMERVRENWQIEFFVLFGPDLEPLQKLIQLTGLSNSRVHCVYHDGYRYLKCVRRMNAFVGIKLHSVILSMCAGVPSIMIEYAPKCRDFMASVDLEEFCVDVDGIDAGSLGTAIEQLSSTAIVTSRQIVDRMNDYRDRLLKQAARIRSTIGDDSRIHDPRR
jgi:polysaccharide pyruvyl transferase WcaK-like protein